MDGGAPTLSADSAAAAATTAKTETQTPALVNGAVKRRNGGNNRTEAAPNGVKVMAAKKALHYHSYSRPSFLKWRLQDAVHVATHHWMPCLFAVGLLFFMAVEYTLRMVPPSSPPFDLGFIATRSLHHLLQDSPNLNTVLAFLNTVFVGMQMIYIMGAWLIEGRPRATISALFMFTCRGILGYSTQLPLPQGFLGSGVDFPVGNVSFFLFFSGHVAGSVIASLDMRRMKRHELAWLFDVLNLLQAGRLLGTRGHYTIDLAVGVGAGILFDSLAGKYEEFSQSKLLSLNGDHINGVANHTKRNLIP
ncbi:phosphatidylcholine:diacylglycerol cholinephosphotransferase 1-like [Arachis stenosperma]|uniref:phosphatidylcholine:diacylglycerol cholinephosphotransferase 1-like n=1 Tax=Arachis stenosperma TaxID=217475 RepID=UPI0025ABAD35|nr:phosphatidylcholine:diacylglycerol cholinephosphotransferase 1-like [Arachis stenosperma]